MALDSERRAAPDRWVTLAHLAVGGDDDRVRALYWRGDAVPSGSGGLTVAAGGQVDLGTWFNAAPVGWWRNIVNVTTIRLTLVGSGSVTVFRAGAGGRHAVTTIDLNGAGEIDLPAGDVTWYWLTLRSGKATGRLESVRWSARPRGPSSRTANRATVVVPTFGRERDALEQVTRLLSPAMSDVVARVILVDQAGTVASAPTADQVIADAEDRLILVQQDNLGGSGGYARGMLESLAFPDDAVLLLDDDAHIEPDGLRRMLTLIAAAGPDPRLILGTPLLSAEAPTLIEALAEGVRRRDFRWGATDRLNGAVDVAVTDPSAWSFASPGARTDYSGWWGTLLPPGAVAELGLPAPYFLKWDDAEYGLRAERAGYRVATVPGTGTWHPTWAAKGTISSWAAWPLHRNRLATAAAYRSGRGVLLDSLVHQVKHVLSLQYDTARLWDAALAQFLAGPAWLTKDLRSTRTRAQAVLDAAAPHEASVAASTVPGGAQASTAQASAPEDDEAVTKSARISDAVTGPARFAFRAVQAVTGLGRGLSVRTVAHVAPDAFTWRDGLGRDVVVLQGTDRALVRDPARARAALRRTMRLHCQAAWRWRRLCRAYARALPASRSAQQWRMVIEER